MPGPLQNISPVFLLEGDTTGGDTTTLPKVFLFLYFCFHEVTGPAHITYLAQGRLVRHPKRTSSSACPLHPSPSQTTPGDEFHPQEKAALDPGTPLKPQCCTPQSSSPEPGRAPRHRPHPGAPAPGNAQPRAPARRRSALT